MQIYKIFSKITCELVHLKIEINKFLLLMKIALYTRKGSHIDNPKLSYLEQRLRDLNADIFYCSIDDKPSSLEDTDLVLSLGGDGTFLEAVAFLKDRQKPIA